VAKKDSFGGKEKRQGRKENIAKNTVGHFAPNRIRCPGFSKDRRGKKRISSGGGHQRQLSSSREKKGGRGREGKNVFVSSAGGGGETLNHWVRDLLRWKDAGGERVIVAATGVLKGRSL